MTIIKTNYIDFKYSSHKSRSYITPRFVAILVRYNNCKILLLICIGVTKYISRFQDLDEVSRQELSLESILIVISL